MLYDKEKYRINIFEKVITMKKVFCSLTALLLCIAFVFAGCSETNAPGSVSENTDRDGQVVNANAGEKSAIVIEEGESVVETNLGAGVELFASGVYYLEGMIYSSDSPLPIALATDGENLQLETTVSDINIGVLVLGDKSYVIQPSKSQYTELSDTLIKVLGLEDTFNISELQGIKTSGDEDANAKIEQMSVTINGENGLCTTYIYEENSLKLYSIGDKLVQVDYYEKDGTLNMQLVIDEITGQIPADQLTLKGMNQVSVTNFMSSFVS